MRPTKKAIQAADDVKHVEMGYSADVLLKNSNLVTKVFSVTNDTKLNQYQAIAGRLPDKSGEIALDSKSKMRKHYKLGDRVTFVDSDGSKLTKKIPNSHIYDRRFCKNTDVYPKRRARQ